MCQYRTFLGSHSRPSFILFSLYNYATIKHQKWWHTMIQVPYDMTCNSGSRCIGDIECTVNLARKLTHRRHIAAWERWLTPAELLVRRVRMLTSRLHRQLLSSQLDETHTYTIQYIFDIFIKEWSKYKLTHLKTVPYQSATTPIS